MLHLRIPADRRPVPLTHPLSPESCTSSLPVPTASPDDSFLLRSAQPSASRSPTTSSPSLARTASPAPARASKWCKSCSQWASAAAWRGSRPRRPPRRWRSSARSTGSARAAPSKRSSARLPLGDPAPRVRTSSHLLPQPFPHALPRISPPARSFLQSWVPHPRRPPELAGPQRHAAHWAQVLRRHPAAHPARGGAHAGAGAVGGVKAWAVVRALAWRVDHPVLPPPVCPPCCSPLPLPRPLSLFHSGIPNSLRCAGDADLRRCRRCGARVLRARRAAVLHGGGVLPPREGELWRRGCAHYAHGAGGLAGSATQAPQTTPRVWCAPPDGFAQLINTTRHRIPSFHYHSIPPFPPPQGSSALSSAVATSAPLSSARSTLTTTPGWALSSSRTDSFTGDWTSRSACGRAGGRA